MLSLEKFLLSISWSPSHLDKSCKLPASIFKDADKKESPAPASSPSPDEFPVVCAKTQCIICIGNNRLSYEQRTRSFRRVAHMWDHIENVHLRGQVANGAFVCHHPI
ncbi:hypothetical protein CJF32_00002529 [Rutstroemia sp. NJR-2017a WRK4]|nr:hypothetical protein CJF32_00007402 [Rutstroemia sp. NJR-2017a WRK4]PQE11733.1 hypothetical protein CJF32_00002529 [Rutstroemia sp. NJR-2017a WRK4]